MQFRGLFLRAGAALAALTIGAEILAPAAAEASTPALVWQDMARVNILCLVRTDDGVDSFTLNDLVCNKVRDIAAQGSPVSVQVIAPGDPALLSPDSVTLLVHASMQRELRRPLLAFTIRPFRNSADQGQLIFTAAPRAVPLRAAPGEQPELEAALRAALSETLPWLSSPAGPQPIS